jgi:two-component system phosphate regulon sensor histidine kinase PhoR
MLQGSMHRWSHSVGYGAFVVALLAWGVQLAGVATSFSVQVALASATVAACAAAAFVARREARLRYAEMRRFLETLCNDDLERLVEAQSQGLTPVFLIDPEWSSLLHRLRDNVVDLAHRACEAQHSRAGAEVRIRRTGAERDQMREILSATPDPILMIDAYNEITYANAVAERLFGLQRSGDSFGPLSKSLGHETLRSLLVETRKRNSLHPRIATLTMNDVTGREWDFRVSARCFAPATAPSDGRAAGQPIVAVFTDIGAQRVLQQRNAEFVSSVSHEMKTPLAGINAYVELLADGDADDEATREEFLGVIKSQAERLQRLVENLLNLARIEAGVVKVNKRPQSLNEVLQDAYNVLAPTADIKNIRLVCELSSMYLGVFADHDTLLQAAINLGSNAIKYTPPGGRVVLRSRMLDHEIVFEVQDTGVGLDEEDRLKVFEKFYRVKKDSNMAPGTGLGLPLVKHIVEDVHGGRIEVDSQLGQGSTFRVLLPANDQIKHV